MTKTPCGKPGPLSELHISLQQCVENRDSCVLSGAFITWLPDWPFGRDQVKPQRVHNERHKHVYRHHHWNNIQNWTYGSLKLLNFLVFRWRKKTRILSETVCYYYVLRRCPLNHYFMIFFILFVWMMRLRLFLFDYAAQLSWWTLLSTRLLCSRKSVNFIQNFNEISSDERRRKKTR